ncbi:MAG: hypothetical protein E7050_07470 [Lentisphaerae bacterium]|nr:hypothetical protein [Lentisphaerota bacterium]
MLQAGQYFLNADLKADELREQAGKLYEAGYEMIFLHARAGLATPYLSKKWFEALQVIIDELAAHNVKFGIWDEDNFPSGTAGGRVVANHPEMRASYLDFVSENISANEHKIVFCQENAAFLRGFFLSDKGEITDISEYCGTLRRQWTPRRLEKTCYSLCGNIPLPHRRRNMDITRFAIEYTAPENGRIILFQIIRNYNLHSADLLNPLAVKYFIDCTFGNYSKYLTEAQLQQCAASFMDEPSLLGIYSWTENFAETFLQNCGYDILEKLPDLITDINPDSAKVRFDYRETIRKLLAKNYLKKIKDHVNSQNMLSIGHLVRSEWLSKANISWPNEFRMFKEFDIPCCDPLGGGVGLPGEIAHHIGIKAVSSAAHFFGKIAAGADAFAVGGGVISLKDLRYMLEYHLVLGITWFNIHGLYYTLESERRDEAPPSLFYQHSQWPHMKTFIDYLKKRCMELTGRHICSFAMLYPSCSLQSAMPDEENSDSQMHSIAELLLANQQDFELIDEITLCEQDIESFYQQYPYFVVPYAKYLSADTAAFLEAYSSAGGMLIVCGKIPCIIETGKIWQTGKNAFVKDVYALLPESPVSGENKKDILLRQIIREECLKTYLFNRSQKDFYGKFDGKEIVIPAGVGGFTDEFIVKKNLSSKIEVKSWQLNCSANHVPLHLWFYCGGHIDLLQVNAHDPELFHPDKIFYSEFFAEKSLHLELITENAALQNCEFYLNGKKLDKFEWTEFRDCREKSCVLEGLLLDGKNQIGIRGRILENPPYLRGNFYLSYPWGSSSLPWLKQWKMPIFFTDRIDLSSCGLCTYSGRVVCSAEITIDIPGEYVLDAEEIFDSGKLLIDGIDCGTKISRPFCWKVHLDEGVHQLVLEICNAPGNRDIKSNLPTGIIFNK